MSRTTFIPVPEAQQDMVVPASRLTLYPSRAVDGAVSVMLVSDDSNLMIQGAIRLTAEQVETLFYSLADQIGDERYDLGFRAGQEAGFSKALGAGATVEAIAAIIDESGQLGCGCCVFNSTYIDGKDDCEKDEDGYLDHSYSEGCLQNLTRSELIAHVVIEGMKAKVLA